MTVEISWRKPFNLPHVFWAQHEDSRKEAHWIGRKSALENGQVNPGNQNKDQKSKKRKSGYRPLADITLGEVEDIYHYFEHQLLVGQAGWVGKNHFCQIPLERSKDGRPPVVFGRVKTCHPSDGHIDNVEEMELYFPHKECAPDVLHIHRDEIDQNAQKRVQSYFVRVRVLTSDDEQAELAEASPKLRLNGFYPEFESSPLDLLETTIQNQSFYPWMIVIGSRWFASVPESLMPEVAGKLKEMLAWGKQVFNYHPEWLNGDVVTLNRVLGFKYKFTPQVLIEPGNAQELSFIVANTFEKLVFNSTV